VSRSRARIGVGLVVIASALVALAGPAHAQSVDQANRLELEQNFPNPFAPGTSETIFTYTIPDEGPVELVVYNLLAQEIVTLVDEIQEVGRHRVAWDGLDASGNIVPPGIYYYKLSAGGEERLRRLRVLTAFTPEAEARPTADVSRGAAAR